jgi:outer membrane biosynthesis protein TonB
MGQDASFASMGTALGRYQHKLYLAIGSRWNGKVAQTMAQIGVDRVVVRFHVNADGTISDIDIVQGNPNSILGMISGDSIKQSSNLIGPFPADLKAEKPGGFPWQLAFRIY